MKVTQVRVKLEEDQGKLKAYCSFVFDDSLCVRDLKVIESQGRLLLCMPVRKCTARCPGCKGKNETRANYCNWCGQRLESDHDRRQTHDIAHPVTQEFRRELEEAIFAAYYREIAASKLPGYVPTYFGGGASMA